MISIRVIGKHKEDVPDKAGLTIGEIRAKYEVPVNYTLARVHNWVRNEQEIKSLFHTIEADNEYITIDHDHISFCPRVKGQ